MSIEGGQTKESAPEINVEIYNPSAHTWSIIKDDILNLEETCFPETAFSEEELREGFESSEYIIALLKKGSKIIGFTYGKPDSKTEGALYIETTDIDPAEQGKGNIVPLIAALEDEARKRGYVFLTRNAARDNGYAEKIKRSYGDRVVESYDNDSVYGPQTYFKIRL